MTFKMFVVVVYFIVDEIPPFFPPGVSLEQDKTFGYIKLPFQGIQVLLHHVLLHVISSWYFWGKLC